jgi:hypothetical protein
MVGICSLAISSKKENNAINGTSIGTISKYENKSDLSLIVFYTGLSLLILALVVLSLLRIISAYTADKSYEGNAKW